MKRYSHHLVVTLAMLGLAPSISQAGPFSGEVSGSTEGTGSDYEGEFIYSPTSSTEATLTITLDNLTDPDDPGGFLTAFVFNNPDGRITGADLTSAPTGFDTFVFDDNDVNAQPFGLFDFGVGVGGNANSVFQGGGSPQDGLAGGTSGTWVFDLEGTDLDTLTQEDFLAELSVGPGPIDDDPAKNAQFFVARFRGLEDGGSDKVPAIPEPASLTLLGIGLGVLARGSLQRRNKPTVSRA